MSNFKSLYKTTINLQINGKIYNIEPYGILSIQDKWDYVITKRKLHLEKICDKKEIEKEEIEQANKLLEGLIYDVKRDVPFNIIKNRHKIKTIMAAYKCADETHCSSFDICCCTNPQMQKYYEKKIYWWEKVWNKFKPRPKWIIKILIDEGRWEEVPTHKLWEQRRNSGASTELQQRLIWWGGFAIIASMLSAFVDGFRFVVDVFRFLITFLFISCFILLTTLSSKSEINYVPNVVHGFSIVGDIKQHRVECKNHRTTTQNIH